jgi:hypothetical protein
MSVRMLRSTLLAWLSISAACSDGSEPEPERNPTPTLSAVAPSSVLVGGDDFVLVVRGERFADGATVRWNGQPRPTTRVGQGELRARIAAADIAERARVSVTVVNPAPGGGESSAKVLEISEIPVASVTVTPNPATVAAGQMLALSAKVRDANGRELGSRPITWSSTAPQVAAVSADGIITGVAPGATTIIASVEEVEVAVPLTVGAPSVVPVLSELVPSIAVAGDAAIELTVRGSGFTDGVTAAWNGAARTTRFVSSLELRVQLAAADLAAAGTAKLSVSVAAGASNELSFVVSAGVASVEIRGKAELWSSDVAQYEAVVYDTERRALPGRAVQWSSANTDVLMVDPHGLAFAPGSGSATLSARAGTVTGMASVRVLARPAHDLLYQSTRGGRPTLLIQPMDVDAPPRLLLADGRVAEHPAVSPDGQWVAFTSPSGGTNTDIYLVRRDGGGLRRLTDDVAMDEQPAWSPDGTRIAFRSMRTGDGDIYVMNADGSDQRQVTGLQHQLGDPSRFEPAWTADGQRILFAEGSATVAPFRSSLMSVRPDGTDLRVFSELAGYSIQSPAASPDGRFVAASRHRVGSTLREVVLLTPDGRDAVLIHYPGQGDQPAWSPDGKWLAYTDLGGDVALTQPNEPVYRKITARATGGGDRSSWLPR